VKAAAPPNVLHLVWGFSSGGTENQLLQLVRSQRTSGAFEVHLATLRRVGVLLPDFDAVSGGAVPEFPTKSFYGYSMLLQLFRFARHLQSLRIDVVHTHDFYSNVFGMLGATIAGVPVRIASKRETLGLRSRAQDFIERNVYRLAHRVVANAASVRDHLIGSGVAAGKIVTIHNGVDPARVQVPEQWQKSEACADFGLPPGRRYVSILASLRAVKDHATLLRAARKVSDEVPDVCFVLAGEGALRDELDAQARALGISERVRFIGHCAQPGALLALSDVCVLSSRAEGFSNSLLEYMAAGRAVVATDVGGAREVVAHGRTGYLVQAGDAEAMASCLVRLLLDPALALAMGRAGRAVVETGFSRSAVVARTEELYCELLGGRRRAV
jgi:glycosyltransferase involved in cell wall biosynthesis